LHGGGNGKKFEKPSYNLYMNNMAVNFDMLSEFMEDMIVGYLNNRSNVAIEDGRLKIRNPKVLEKVHQPLDSTYSS